MAFHIEAQNMRSGELEGSLKTIRVVVIKLLTLFCRKSINVVKIPLRQKQESRTSRYVERENRQTTLFPIVTESRIAW